MYILSIDQGTTSTRCILFNTSGKIIAIAQKEIKQSFPQPGWVEHDPEEIFLSVVITFKQCLKNAQITADKIISVGITNQRETTVVWNRKTGKAVYPAIVWQSRQSAAICDRWKEAGFEDIVSTKTGLIIDAYFSSGKIAWILENVSGARTAAKNAELAFGTIDTWLLWKLSGGKVHATDCSNASRTSLFNIHSQQWDTDLLNAFNIPASMLPEVKDSAGHFCIIEEYSGFSLPVTGVLGDQQSALLGQACIEPGMAKNTYGTGCFMLMNTGEKAVVSSKGLIATIAWKIHGKICYALEGSVFVAGSAIQWLRDGVGLISNSAETEDLALAVETAGGVYFVPAFTGLGAPFWDQSARGAFYGITGGTKKSHLVRAALEAMAYQTKDVFSLMETEATIPLKTLRVDGGAAANNFMMQFQADILGVSVDRPEITESTALGAALIAGIGAGVWPDIESCTEMRISERQFSPLMPADKAAGFYRGWQSAVNATIFFSQNR